MSGHPQSESLLSPAFLNRLEKLDLVARRIFSGERRGDFETRRRGAGSIFRDHKPYVQGDDLRFVDWNVYSRLGELLIKTFTSEENLSLTLLLDCSASMDLAETRKFLCARRIAAILGLVALNRSATVVLGTMNRTSNLRNRFEYRGRRHFEEMLQVLNDQKAHGTIDLLESVTQLAHRRRGRGIVVIISDFFIESGYERALHFLRHSGYSPAVIHVVDEIDTHPGLAGRTSLEDVETSQSLIENLAPELIEAYEVEVRSWCDRVAEFCRSHAMAYSRVSPTFSEDTILKALLFEGGILA